MMARRAWAGSAKAARMNVCMGGAGSAAVGAPPAGCIITGSGRGVATTAGRSAAAATGAAGRTGTAAAAARSASAWACRYACRAA